MNVAVTDNELVCLARIPVRLTYSALHASYTRLRHAEFGLQKCQQLENGMDTVRDRVIV